MDFYHDLITQKSWKTLQELKKKYEFILIGGWAVFLYTKALKSKDIDLVMGYEELEKLKGEFEVSKNERLRKYEARKEEMEIDIYVPFYSNPGLPPEFIQKYLTTQEGFRIPRPEILLILKQNVYEQRKLSVKGQKDKIDIFSLLTLDLDFSFYHKILKETGQEELKSQLENLLKNTIRIKELNLTNHRMAKLKKRAGKAQNIKKQVS